MKKLLLSFLVLFSLPSFSASYKCTLNVAHSKGQLKDKLYKFTYNSLKDTSKSLQFSGYRFLVWASGEYLMVKIKGEEFKKSLSLQFSLKQSEARFHYGENFDFLCTRADMQKGSSSSQKGSDFSLLKDNIKVAVNSSIIFPYHQPEEVELMRTLYFQDKKVLTESASLVPKLPWCGLRVQLSRNEDTTINKGEIFTPVSFEVHNNNSYFTTYSYSFVDFSSGKKLGATRLYNPFILNCNVLRGMKFDEDTLMSIVGKYLKFMN